MPHIVLLYSHTSIMITKNIPMVPLEHKLLLFHIGLTEQVNTIFVIYVFGIATTTSLLVILLFFLILKMLQSIFSLKLLPKILAPFLCLPDTLKLSSSKKWASSSFTRFVIIYQNYICNMSYGFKHSKFTILSLTGPYEVPP